MPIILEQYNCFNLRSLFLNSMFFRINTLSKIASLFRKMMNMKSSTRTAISSLIMATLVLSPLAEAKRIGGGSSHGMSRSSSSSYGQSNYGSSNNYSNYNSTPARPYTPLHSLHHKKVAQDGVASPLVLPLVPLAQHC